MFGLFGISEKQAKIMQSPEYAVWMERAKRMREAEAETMRARVQQALAELDAERERRLAASRKIDPR